MALTRCWVSTDSSRVPIVCITLSEAVVRVPSLMLALNRRFHPLNASPCFDVPQAQLVYEAGQIKGSIAMTHPDRIHASKTGGSEHGGGGNRGSFCNGVVDNKPAAHLLEMVIPPRGTALWSCQTHWRLGHC